MDILEKHFTLYGNTEDHICKRTFTRLFQEIEAAGCPPLTILETGSAAHGTYSSYLFDAYVRKYGGKFWTVDINPETSAKLAPNVGPTTTVVCGDSVEFLKSWVRDHPGEKADVVYLDSFDMNWTNPIPSGLHGLKEYAAVLPALQRGSLLLIDDTPTISEEFLYENSGYYREIGPAFERFKIPVGKGMFIPQVTNATVLDHWYQLLYRF